jgi:hypothetical protein
VGLESGIISDVMKYIKQNEFDKAQKILDEKMNHFYTEEVQDKRIRISELNRSIVQIDIELKKLGIQDDLIKKKVPGAMLETIERYKYGLKKKRAELEIMKKQASLSR